MPHAPAEVVLPSKGTGESAREVEAALEDVLHAPSKEGVSAGEHKSSRQRSLNELCRSEHGRHLLGGLLEALDDCIGWCDRHPESDASITLAEYKAKSTAGGAVPTEAHTRLSE
eukprot:Hpha_TRINITY_DN36903_c0_g1::TRINITY_DN36903_c0_g1_i1::g.170911::m.170911